MADLQSMIAQAGAQQQQSPDAQFKPTSIPSVGEMLAAYRQRNQAISMSTESSNIDASMSQNPWAPDEINANSLEQEKADHQAWLSTQPVSVQMKSQIDPDVHKHILNNIARDPAVQEIEEPLFQILDTLKGYVQNGQMSHEEAIGHLAEAAPMIEEAVHRHHGPHSISHKQSITVDPDLHQESSIAKKAKSYKGGY